MLTCTKCNETKPPYTDHFPPHNKKKNGLDSWCRQCRSSYRSEIRRGKYRHFGYSDEFIKDLVATGECVICGENGPRLAVDHDHSNGNVRGLLCMNCNQGLGKFKDDPQLLEFARIYLLSAKDSHEAENYLARQS